MRREITSKKERERRESVGKVLTRQEMFRIFDGYWVLLEMVYWPKNWRQRTGIIHAYAKDSGELLKQINKVIYSGKTLFREYFGPPVRHPVVM